MKVAVFTPRSVNPLHPRLILFEKFFKSKNLPVDFINVSETQEASSRINWLSLWFFDIKAILKLRSMIDDYDVAIVNDLRYLPICYYLKKKNKKVIYDTIDHNVQLRFYQLQKRFRMLRILKRPIQFIFQFIEKRLAFTHCDHITVNSDSLNTYFRQRASILYYSSPLENRELINLSTHPPALLYLGAFTRDKGASVMLNLAALLNIKLHVFGNATEPGIIDQMKESSQLVHCPKISIGELELKLKELMGHSFLIGLSVIHSVHKSYAFQEANKDIDYLALGIPLIGNRRMTTKQKIEFGCGWFIDDLRLLQKISEANARKTASEKCRTLYAQQYSQEIFFTKLNTVWEKLF